MEYGQVVSTQVHARRARARRGDGARLRAEIMAAASRLLADLAEESQLSLRAVAREVGVATTSIYLHFPDLDTLVREVKVQHFQELTADIRAALASAGDDPRRRVRTIADVYVDYGLSNPGHYRALFVTPYVVSAAGTGRPMMLGEEAFDLVLAEIAGVVGAQRSWLVMVHFWTALHGLVMMRTARRQFEWPSVEEELDDLTGLLLATP